jgi:hypothetical protein
MQTTLRIDDRIYREAKAEAAREGVTLTRFLEEGLRLRLEAKRTPSVGGDHFRVFSAGRADSITWENSIRIAEEEQEAADLAKLGMNRERTE